MPYEFLEHTADLKIKVEEPSLDEAFKTAAFALKQAMAENITVNPKTTKLINVDGKNLNELLYNFIEEFIYLLDAENFILADVLDLEVNKDREKNAFVLSATISGDSAGNYQFTNDVKAVTFNDMEINEDKKSSICTLKFVLDV